MKKISSSECVCQVSMIPVIEHSKEDMRYLCSSPENTTTIETIVTNVGISIVTSNSDEPKNHKQYIKYPSQEGHSMFDEYFDNNISLLQGIEVSQNLNIEENNVKNCTMNEKKKEVSESDSNRQSPVPVENLDIFSNAQELLLPRSVVVENSESITKAVHHSFGSSLIGSYSEQYLSDFVLHGTNETDFENKLKIDINMAVQNSVLDQSVSESVCILADTDKWQVQLSSSQFLERPGPISVAVGMSQLVSNMIESVNELWKLKMSPEFCLMHLEDSLQELYSKSKLLTTYLRGQRSVNTRQMTATIGCDQSDIPLLLAVISTHSPQISRSFF